MRRLHLKRVFKDSPRKPSPFSYDRIGNLCQAPRLEQCPAQERKRPQSSGTRTWLGFQVLRCVRATQIQPQSLGLGTNPAWQCHRSRTPKVPRASPPAHPPALACCDFQIKPSFSRARAPLTPLCLCASPEVTARASSSHSPWDTARVPLPTTAALPATHSPCFPPNESSLEIQITSAWRALHAQPRVQQSPRMEGQG